MLSYEKKKKEKNLEPKLKFLKCFFSFENSQVLQKKTGVMKNGKRKYLSMIRSQLSSFPNKFQSSHFRLFVCPQHPYTQLACRSFLQISKFPLLCTDSPELQRPWVSLPSTGGSPTGTPGRSLMWSRKSQLMDPTASSCRSTSPSLTLTEWSLTTCIWI